MPPQRVAAAQRPRKVHHKKGHTKTRATLECRLVVVAVVVVVVVLVTIKSVCMITAPYACTELPAN